MLGDYLLQQLNKLRQTERLCDLDLVVEDGSSFPMHEIVFVCLNKKHFQLCKKNNSGTRKKMFLPRVSAEEIKLLVSFMYGETVKRKSKYDMLVSVLEKLDMLYLIGESGGLTFENDLSDIKPELTDISSNSIKEDEERTTANDAPDNHRIYTDIDQVEGDQTNKHYEKDNQIQNNVLSSNDTVIEENFINESIIEVKKEVDSESVTFQNATKSSDSEIKQSFARQDNVETETKLDSCCEDNKHNVEFVAVKGPGASLLKENAEQILDTENNGFELKIEDLEDPNPNGDTDITLTNKNKQDDNIEINFKQTHTNITSIDSDLETDDDIPLASLSKRQKPSSSKEETTMTHPHNTLDNIPKNHLSQGEENETISLLNSSDDDILEISLDDHDNQEVSSKDASINNLDMSFTECSDIEDAIDDNVESIIDQLILLENPHDALNIVDNPIKGKNAVLEEELITISDDDTPTANSEILQNERVEKGNSKEPCALRYPVLSSTLQITNSVQHHLNNLIETNVDGEITAQDINKAIQVSQVAIVKSPLKSKSKDLITKDLKDIFKSNEKKSPNKSQHGFDNSHLQAARKRLKTILKVKTHNKKQINHESQAIPKEVEKKNVTTTSKTKMSPEKRSNVENNEVFNEETEGVTEAIEGIGIQHETDTSKYVTSNKDNNKEKLACASGIKSKERKLLPKPCFVFMQANQELPCKRKRKKKPKTNTHMLPKAILPAKPTNKEIIPSLAIPSVSDVSSCVNNLQSQECRTTATSANTKTSISSVSNTSLATSSINSTSSLCKSHPSLACLLKGVKLTRDNSTTVEMGKTNIKNTENHCTEFNIETKPAEKNSMQTEGNIALMHKPFLAHIPTSEILTLTSFTSNEISSQGSFENGTKTVSTETLSPCSVTSTEESRERNAERKSQNNTISSKLQNIPTENCKMLPPNSLYGITSKIANEGTGAIKTVENNIPTTGTPTVTSCSASMIAVASEANTTVSKQTTATATTKVKITRSPNVTSTKGLGNPNKKCEKPSVLKETLKQKQVENSMIKNRPLPLNTVVTKLFPNSSDSVPMTKVSSNAIPYTSVFFTSTAGSFDTVPVVSSSTPVASDKTLPSPFKSPTLPWNISPNTRNIIGRQILPKLPACNSSPGIIRYPVAVVNVNNRNQLNLSINSTDLFKHVQDNTLQKDQFQTEVATDKIHMEKPTKQHKSKDLRTDSDKGTQQKTKIHKRAHSLEDLCFENKTKKQKLKSIHKTLKWVKSLKNRGIIGSEAKTEYPNESDISGIEQNYTNTMSIDNDPEMEDDDIPLAVLSKKLTSPCKLTEHNIIRTLYSRSPKKKVPNNDKENKYIEQTIPEYTTDYDDITSEIDYPGCFDISPNESSYTYRSPVHSQVETADDQYHETVDDLLRNYLKSLKDNKYADSERQEEGNTNSTNDFESNKVAGTLSRISDFGDFIKQHNEIDEPTLKLKLIDDKPQNESTSHQDLTDRDYTLTSSSESLDINRSPYKQNLKTLENLEALRIAQGGFVDKSNSPRHVHRKIKMKKAPVCSPKTVDLFAKFKIEKLSKEISESTANKFGLKSKKNKQKSSNKEGPEFEKLKPNDFFTDIQTTNIQYNSPTLEINEKSHIEEASTYTMIDISLDKDITVNAIEKDNKKATKASSLNILNVESRQIRKIKESAEQKNKIDSCDESNKKPDKVEGKKIATEIHKSAESTNLNVTSPVMSIAGFSPLTQNNLGKKSKHNINDKGYTNKSRKQKDVLLKRRMHKKKKK